MIMIKSSGDRILGSTFIAGGTVREFSVPTMKYYPKRIKLL